MRLFWFLIAGSAACFLWFQIQEPGSLSAQLCGASLIVLSLLTATRSWASVAKQEKRRNWGAVWIRLAAGVAIWCIAVVMEALEIVLGEPAYGTVADAFWVTGYLPLLQGLWMAVSALDGWKKSRPVALSSLWIVCCLCLLVAFVIPKALEQDRTLVLILDLFYFSADTLLVLLSLLMILAASRQADFRFSFRFLLGAFFLFFVTDFFLILYTDPALPLYQWSDIVYASGYLMLFFAGRTLYISQR